MLTKKQAVIIRMASRPCGLSYRAGCKRNRELCLEFKRLGYLRISENKKKTLGRFIWWATEKGKQKLAEYENRHTETPTTGERDE